LSKNNTKAPWLFGYWLAGWLPASNIGHRGFPRKMLRNPLLLHFHDSDLRSQQLLL